ncbi:MAG: hypothetical protein K0B16_03455 [Burkholderiaceae bacterium]|nr:hypothetical protein [Burkholderiaceae bacterium]
MATEISREDGATRRTGPNGQTAEVRRFAAGIRLITALLVSVLIITDLHTPGATVTAVLLAYGGWAAWLLWGEANAMPRAKGVWLYWVDVAWACACMQLVQGGTDLLVMTLVMPIVLASIGIGARHGLALAIAAAAGTVLAGGVLKATALDDSLRSGLLVLMVGLLAAVALIARPLNQLRQRLALAGDYETQLDPRRGVEAISAALVERLREDSGASVAALVLPSHDGAPATIASVADGAFRAKPEVHTLLESKLAALPDCAVSRVTRRWWAGRPAVWLNDDRPEPEGLERAVCELANLLEVRGLHIVPLTRYRRQHGHCLLGYAKTRDMPADASALLNAAPELLRVIESASVVDKLQESSASEERARIGRDLHDSAIQPYLGLKFAVESAALRIPADNPARGELEALAALVNNEVSSLRELISGLRSGEGVGDDALVPAVRRQCRHFSQLFGIDVTIETPSRVPTTRALASSVFHMVNEVLNNIRKHTVARHVWIKLAVDSGILELIFRDDSGSINGRAEANFDPKSIGERATELGGSLEIMSPDGLNTELLIRIPLQQGRVGL